MLPFRRDSTHSICHPIEWTRMRKQKKNVSRKKKTKISPRNPKVSILLFIKRKINLTFHKWYRNERLMCESETKNAIKNANDSHFFFVAVCSQTFQLTNWKWVHGGALMVAAVVDFALCSMCGFNAKNQMFVVKVTHARVRTRLYTCSSSYQRR